ncbi:MAG: hypothetical protein HRT61_20390 [Ekhidna sp.]|nr:hypothetical protein [Ekhidna sp.]
MRILTILTVLIFAASCSSGETASYETSETSVSGEFLFEGPNTLQGPSTVSLSQIAKDLNISEEKIQEVSLASATIQFANDSLQSTVESALLQLVSDELALISIGTKSPFPATGPVALEVNTEQDILPYLKDSSTTAVVDVNLNQDLDDLQATITFSLNVKY